MILELRRTADEQINRGKLALDLIELDGVKEVGFGKGAQIIIVEPSKVGSIQEEIRRLTKGLVIAMIVMKTE